MIIFPASGPGERFIVLEYCRIVATWQRNEKFAKLAAFWANNKSKIRSQNSVPRKLKIKRKKKKCC